MRPPRMCCGPPAGYWPSIRTPTRRCAAGPGIRGSRTIRSSTARSPWTAPWRGAGWCSARSCPTSTRPNCPPSRSIWPGSGMVIRRSCPNSTGYADCTGRPGRRAAGSSAARRTRSPCGPISTARSRSPRWVTARSTPSTRWAVPRPPSASAGCWTARSCGRAGSWWHRCCG